MKHRVSNLEGALLDAAVAMAEGWRKAEDDPAGWWSSDGHASSIEKQGIREGYGYHPAHNWAQGGPIIERERITIRADFSPEVPGNWVAMGPAYAEGPTPLIAAMRALVCAKLGEEVDLP